MVRMIWVLVISVVMSHFKTPHDANTSATGGTRGCPYDSPLWRSLQGRPHDHSKLRLRTGQLNADSGNNWHESDGLRGGCLPVKMPFSIIWGHIGDYITGWELGIRWNRALVNGPLTRYAKLRVVHAPGMPGTFPQPLPVSEPDQHHGTCLAYVPWCMPGSLTSSFHWSRWRGKRSKHSRCMRNT